MTVSQVFVFDRVWIRTVRLPAGVTVTFAETVSATVVFVAPTLRVTDVLDFFAAAVAARSESACAAWAGTRRVDARALETRGAAIRMHLTVDADGRRTHGFPWLSRLGEC